MRERSRPFATPAAANGVDSGGGRSGSSGVATILVVAAAVAVAVVIEMTVTYRGEEPNEGWTGPPVAHSTMTC